MRSQYSVRSPIAEGIVSAARSSAPTSSLAALGLSISMKAWATRLAVHVTSAAALSSRLDTRGASRSSRARSVPAVIDNSARAPGSHAHYGRREHGPFTPGIRVAGPKPVDDLQSVAGAGSGSASCRSGLIVRPQPIAARLLHATSRGPWNPLRYHSLRSRIFSKDTSGEARVNPNTKVLSPLGCRHLAHDEGHQREREHMKVAASISQRCRAPSPAKGWRDRQLQDR